MHDYYMNRRMKYRLRLSMYNNWDVVVFLLLSFLFIACKPLPCDISFLLSPSVSFSD